MSAFSLRGTTIIKLTAAYSLLIGIIGVYNTINTYILTSKSAKPLGLFGILFLLLFTFPFIADAIVLFRSWRGAWRSTIILYGFVFTIVLLSGITSQFANYTVWNLFTFIVNGIIVSVFWTNTDVKAALGKFKNAAVPSVDFNPPNM